ncbi:MAG: BON domain-containing protein [Fluviicola sp.]
MKTNSELQKDVQDAIRWEPLINAAEIGVTVKDGVVTLTGTVDNYLKKIEAENATKNVEGVKAVVEKIEVQFPNSWRKNDNEVAKEVVNALQSDFSVPNDKVKVKVENGWVTLEGEVNWDFQREAAKKAIRGLQGVVGINSRMTIKSESHDAIEQKDVEKALERNWSIDPSDISVKVDGTKVTLTGTVRSLYQKNEAEHIAYKTKGIWLVDNKLEVEYDYELAL